MAAGFVDRSIKVKVKKALFIVSSLVRSGPTRQLFNICKQIESFGYKPYVLTLSGNPPGNLEAEFRYAGLDIRSLRLSRVQGLMLARSRALKQIEAVEPNIIHTSGIRSDFLGHRLSGLAPHVMTVRNYAWDDYPAKFGVLPGAVLAASHIGLVRRAMAPVACAESLANRFNSRGFRLPFIRNGVDLADYRPTQVDERTELRSKLGLNDGGLIVVSVGSLIKRKRPAVLLRAFLDSPLRKAGSLIFVGDGPLRGKLMQMAAGCTSIRFVGDVPDVGMYLKCSDVFASASAGEGFPSSVLEALATGLPVVLSDIESHLESGVQQANAGFVFRLDDQIDLSCKLAELSRADLAVLGRNARRLAERRHSAEKMAGRYARLYDELASGG